MCAYFKVCFVALTNDSSRPSYVTRPDIKFREHCLTVCVRTGTQGAFSMHTEYHMVRSPSIMFSCWVFLMFRAEPMMELDSSRSCGWTVVWLCPDQPHSKLNVFNLWFSLGLHETCSHLLHSEYGHQNVRGVKETGDLEALGPLSVLTSSYIIMCVSWFHLVFCRVSSSY